MAGELFALMAAHAQLEFCKPGKFMTQEEMESLYYCGVINLEIDSDICPVCHTPIKVFGDWDSDDVHYHKVCLMQKRGDDVERRKESREEEVIYKDTFIATLDLKP